jgi:hypothetical protein
MPFQIWAINLEHSIKECRWSISSKKDSRFSASGISLLGYLLSGNSDDVEGTIKDIEKKYGPRPDDIMLNVPTPDLNPAKTD